MGDRSNRVAMKTRLIFAFCLLLTLWFPVSGKYYLIGTQEKSTNMTNVNQQLGSCTCNGALHLGRGECKMSPTICDTWCYVDDDTNCPDARPSSYGAPTSRAVKLVGLRTTRPRRT